MLRLRRYRVFVAFAVIAIFAFYHFSQISGGRQRLASSVETLKSYTSHSKIQLPKSPVGKPQDEKVVENEAKPATTEVGIISSSSSTSSSVSASGSPAQAYTSTAYVTSTYTALSTTPETSLPVPSGLDAPYSIPIEQDGQAGPYPIIHWINQGEHFPISKESVRPIPSGKPKDIPAIQHTFSSKESSAEKEQRIKKLDIIKEALQHTWEGYKEKAWMHDELVPVTGEFKDPFCGWAATLVDTLDTLWIVGLKKEFEEAVDAVNRIDFTTTARNDIPLFETTIRYLGGLLSAYDISGQKHHNLLNKAVELADILMGSFDTPNRMPMAFYRWKPAFASQPHRADTRMVLAEIGSLSLEFTRLAQLTKQPKYYDAIARIMDALEKWQMQTLVPGLWPLSVDASGCEKRSISQELPLQRNASLDSTTTRPDKTKAKLRPTEDTKLELPKNPNYKLPNPTSDPAQPAASVFFDTEKSEAKKQKGSWVPLTDEKADKGWDVDDKFDLPDGDEGDTILNKRQAAVNGPKSAITGTEVFGDTECTPQGLASPWKNMLEEYSIGGRADSVYEYLPKQYLLLGGLEEQYRSMYENAVNAVKRNLLFAPNVPGIDKRKILVAGTLKRSNEKKGEINPEMTHLTCFAGGMLAMASKIFDRPDELELAKQLADGCVWAYEVTKSGIMPEVSFVDMCSSLDKCSWNESQWHEALDPNWQSREEQARIQEEMFGDAELDPTPPGRYDPDKPTPQARPSSKYPKRNKAKRYETSLKDGKVKDNIITGDPTIANGTVPLSKQPPTLSLDAKKKQVEDALNGMPTVPYNLGPAHAQEGMPSRTKPFKSLSHAEYVQERIDNERLPPGFTGIRDGSYILRPEAIESVWVLYRVTGDRSWREKGWRMFKSIQAATRTTYGFSAVQDVMGEASVMSDSMESFWSAETLKYFYLLFSEEEVVSLDEWVLNTEAHPFRRPDAPA